MKRSDIERLLPEVFQRTVQPRTPILAILETMEALHAPAEEVLDDLDSFFDPYCTTDSFVFYLAQWVDLGHFIGGIPGDYRSNTLNFRGGIGRLRELIVAAAYLAKWRGTIKGLIHFLEAATGIPGYEVNELPLDSAGQVRPFHIVVRAPSEAEPFDALIHDIVRVEKPAYVTYNLEYKQ
jgi:phage tail-like protein